MKFKLFFTCLFWVVGCLIVSGFTGWVSASHITGWYQALNQPSFNPPSWVFAPVWTTLYITIGIAGGLLWQKRRKHPLLLFCFTLQLAFNFLWSFIFFVGQNISWALFDILALWISLLCLIIFSARKQKNIMWLLLPYFIWTSFAAILNYSIWQLN